MDNRIVEIVLKARDEASRVLDNVGDAGKRSEGAFSGLKASTVALGTAMGNMALQAGQWAVSQIGGTVTAARESAAAHAELEQTLMQTGRSSQFTTDQLEAMASQIEQTSLFEDEAIMHTQALLLTFDKIGSDTLPAATQAAADLAQLMGGDLQGATLQIAKALQDPEAGLSALRRSGASFTEQQKEMWVEMYNTGRAGEAQAQILAVLNGPNGWGGQAKAASDAAGAQEQLKDKINGLKETVGGFANKTMEQAIRGVFAFSSAFVAADGDVTSTGFSGKMEELGFKIRELADGALVIFKQVWDFLQPSVEAVANSFKENLLPALQKLWEAIQPILPVIGAILVGALWLVINAVNILIKALSFVIEVIATVINWIVAWIKYQWEVSKIVIDVIKDIIAWFGRIPENVSNAVNGIVNWFKSLPGKIVDALSSLWGGVTGLFDRIGTNISNTMSNAWEGMKTGAKSAANWIIDKINGIIRGFNKVAGIVPGVSSNLIPEIPKFATGVSNFRGGLAYVHEGEVLANLPAGTDVIPRDQVNRAIGGGNNNGPMIGTINFEVHNDFDLDVALRQIGYKLAIT